MYLFLLGVLGLVLINAKELSDYFRESLSFSVMLNDDAKEADIRMLQKDLDGKLYVKVYGICFQRGGCCKNERGSGGGFY